MMKKAIEEINRKSHDRTHDFARSIIDVIDSNDEDHSLKSIDTIEDIAFRMFDYGDLLDYDHSAVIQECENLYGINKDIVQKVSKEIYHEIMKGLKEYEL